MATGLCRILWPGASHAADSHPLEALEELIEAYAWTLCLPQHPPLHPILKIHLLNPRWLGRWLCHYTVCYRGEDALGVRVYSTH